jgi:hypothetical protein
MTLEGYTQIIVALALAGAYCITVQIRYLAALLILIGLSTLNLIGE